MPAIDYIDEFPFLELRGMPDAVKRRLAIRDRAGVDGNSFKRTGRRGRMFTLHSRVDTAMFAETIPLFDEYCGLIGENPVDLVYGGIDFSESSTQFEVVDVRIRAMYAAVTGTGGLNPPSGGWLECDWDLVPVVIEEEA